MSIIAFDGHAPQIDESAWVAASATVIGEARLAADPALRDRIREEFVANGMVVDDGVHELR